jgi:hypothetical protein
MQMSIITQRTTLIEPPSTDAAWLSPAKVSAISDSKQIALEQSIKRVGNQLQAELQQLNQQLADLTNPELNLMEQSTGLDQVLTTISQIKHTCQEGQNLLDSLISSRPSIRMVNLVLYFLEISNSEIDSATALAAIVAANANEMNKILDQLSAMATLASYINQTLKGIIQEWNAWNAAHHKDKAPITVFEWKDLANKDIDPELRDLIKSKYHLFFFNTDKYHDVPIMVIPVDKLPSFAQQFCEKHIDGYFLTPTAIDNIMSYISQKLALVLPDTSTDWRGSLYGDFKVALMDSILSEGLTDTLTMKSRAVNEMINTNGSKVTLVQTSIDSFKHSFDTVLSNYRQFINQL